VKLFDYLFYRIYSFYKKKKDSTPVGMSCLVLTGLVCLSLISLNGILSLFISHDFNFSKPIILVVLIVSVYFFAMRYRKKETVQLIVQKYQSEPAKVKKVNGWLFVMYLISIVIIPGIIGYLRHNLGWNI